MTALVEREERVGSDRLNCEDKQQAEKHKGRTKKTKVESCTLKTLRTLEERRELVGRMEASGLTNGLDTGLSVIMHSHDEDRPMTANRPLTAGGRAGGRAGGKVRGVDVTFDRIA